MKFDNMSLSLCPQNHSQFEEKFEEINGVEVPTCLPSSSGVQENLDAATVVENTQLQGQNDHRLSPDLPASQDFIGGIMKIVPSNVDVSPVFFTRLGDITSPKLHFVGDWMFPSFLLLFFLVFTALSEKGGWVSEAGKLLKPTS